jgi:hypothetical protein
MIALAFTFAILSPIIAASFIAGWLRCGSPPWTRHFWNS